MFGLGFFASRTSSNPNLHPPVGSTQSPESVLNPLQVTGTATSTPVPVIQDAASGLETLETLLNVQIPIKDTSDLIVRIGGVPGPIPDNVPAPARQYEVGDQETFWASNTDTNESFEIEVTLQYVTEHSYFWIENGVRFDANELSLLAENFESHIYPTVRDFFGTEWSPGVDNDPRIYIVFARNLGRGIAGYFSSADELHPLAHEFSNAHEMFFMSAENTRMDDIFTYGVLAHEFQHMIHWYGDRNEDIWVNEGFSEVATLLTGYYEGGFDQAYMDNPDISLIAWPEEEDTIPHYGGAFLFFAYFLDRFGEDVTRALVAHQENGLNAIDSLLAEVGIFDPLRNREPGGNDIFQDFAAALYLLDETVGDGRFSLSVYPDAAVADPTERVNSCPTGPQARDVNQFGIDYIRVTCSGNFTLTFQGSTTIDLLPVDPASGHYYFWSNRADEADITLTRKFDFTDHVGALTLEYDAWFDIEADFDYAYLVASTDGETWEILRTPGGTGSDPTGNSFGWAYNGRSRVWIRESVDISRFAGSEVWLRFEYITDGALTGEGLLLDNLAVPETGYFTSFEEDDGGWEAAGFVRVENVIPQTYHVSMIAFGASGTTVTYLDLDASNRLEILIEIGSEIDELVLIVSGTNRFSRLKAGYTFEIQE